MKFYFIGQGLWDVVGGNNTTPPAAGQPGLEEWNRKTGKAMYAMTIAVEDEQLQKIKSARTPKEAWDTLAAAFSKKNEAKLQRLENELFSTSQQNLTVSQYFSKVKALCEEISKLDPENEIGEARMRRIIIHGLRPEFKGLVAATRGWPQQPTLVELENLLANEENLEDKFNKVTIKDEEKALFTKRNGDQGPKKYYNNFKHGEEKNDSPPWRKKHWRGSHSGGAPKNQDSRNGERGDRDRGRGRAIQCFKCKKKGHFARDCWNKEEGNAATSTQHEQSEEEWDLQASLALEEIGNSLEEIF